MNNNIFLFTLFLFNPLLYGGNSSSQSSNKKNISTLNSAQEKPQPSSVIENEFAKRHELFFFDKFLGQTSTSSLEESPKETSPKDDDDNSYYDAFELLPDRPLQRTHSTESNTKELPVESLPKASHQSLAQKASQLAAAETIEDDYIDKKRLESEDGDTTPF